MGAQRVESLSMRLRNNLLALGILLLFLAFGTLYVRFWVVQRPFGIILIVSDALVSRHLTAARLYADGSAHRLALERHFPHAALVRNDSAQFAVADDASAASAMATGRKARHHTVGLDENGNSVASIAEIARGQGRAIGLVTNGRLTDPSVAAFYAHSAKADDAAAHALALLIPESFKVALGGGLDDFLPAGRGGRRRDGRDLLGGLHQPAWELIRTRAELESASAYRDGALLGLFAEGVLAASKEREAGLAQPGLSDLVRRAIQCLETNYRGYVLVIDDALVSNAASLNEGEQLMRETLELDRAVGTAVDYAGEKSLIIVVGRKGIGGFTLSGHPSRQDRGIALLGPTSEGNPSITWATGPKGPQSNEPAARKTQSALHTAEDVIALGRGLGAEKVHGFLDNTRIFEILRDAL
jgi:alkaline phosphatase